MTVESPLAPASAGVVVAIPTFRRPESLRALLVGLMPQAMAAGALVIIGDNDCDARIARLVGDIAQEFDATSRLHYRAVPQRGLSQVRNALLAATAELTPDWRWLVMLDDDGLVTPGWLDAMIACGTSYDADLVGGPVIGVLPPGVSRLARNSVFAARGRWPTGPVPTLNTTQNLAIARRLVDLLPAPLFAAALGASGGEDYDLFRKASLAGGRLVWCDEAVIHEPAPAERLTTRALLHRYYSTGISMAAIDLGYDGRVRQTWSTAKGFVTTVLRTLASTLAGRLDKGARELLMIAHYTGRIAGLLGATTARYAASGSAQP